MFIKFMPGVTDKSYITFDEYEVQPLERDPGYKLM